jgi:hypothetical protein
MITKPLFFLPDKGDRGVSGWPNISHCRRFHQSSSLRRVRLRSFRTTMLPQQQVLIGIAAAIG